jgi:archaeosine-15-forming tRNA-guanine transglycosylase
MIFQNDKRVLYEDDCCHFNKKGNRVLAKSIAKIMKDLIP